MGTTFPCKLFCLTPVALDKIELIEYSGGSRAPNVLAAESSNNPSCCCFLIFICSRYKRAHATSGYGAYSTTLHVLSCFAAKTFGCSTIPRARLPPGYSTANYILPGRCAGRIIVQCARSCSTALESVKGPLISKFREQTANTQV